MAVNDLFKKVPIEVPNKSGFDMSHEHNFSAKVGTLTPALCDLLLPNDSISLSVSSEIQLPPMATDFYGRVKAHYEAFFVPCRLLYGGWQEFMTHPVNGDVYPNGSFSGQKAKYLPTLVVPVGEMGPGSLSDYLGYPMSTSDATHLTDDVQVPNPLKYIAYQCIWDNFYRDSRIQQSAFARPNAVHTAGGTTDIPLTAGVFGAWCLPYVTNYNNYPIRMDNINAPGAGYVNSAGYPLRADECADTHKVYRLRQRNFGRDYFTNVTPLPQAGQPAEVAFGISNNQGSFSIPSLRAANSLQMWLERNNVAGYRYGDQIRAHFGIYPSDAALDRPLYLGRQVVDVYNKSVFQNDGSTSQSQTENPFSTVGSKYGSPLGVGSGNLVSNFTASEHGYIFVMFSLVPDAIYSDTIEPDFWHNKVSDFPFPLLQGIGDEPVFRDQLVGYLAPTLTDSNYTNANDVLGLLHSHIFGYTQRYSSSKFKLDRVSGLLKDGQTLQSFALQRSFNATSVNQNAVISSGFLEIPTNYLDQVSAVSGDVSKYGCWAENYFNYHKSSTLAAYSIPTLGEPKNTHTEVIPNGGTRL